jgi:hypothetical protein
MPNIKFSYLYRDGSNYKKFGYLVFANPDDVNLQELEDLIKSKLIYDTRFYADKWNLPELFTEYIDFRVDPTWHEFESVEYTEAPPASVANLKDFIRLIALDNEQPRAHPSRASG